LNSLISASQRFALAAGGRDEIRFESRKKPEARKMLENGAESHQSAARFVRQPLRLPKRWLKKDTTAKMTRFYTQL